MLADAGRRDDTTTRKAAQGFRCETEVLSRLRDGEDHFAVAVCVALGKSPRASFHRCHIIPQGQRPCLPKYLTSLRRYLDRPRMGAQEDAYPDRSEFLTNCTRNLDGVARPPRELPACSGQSRVWQICIEQ